MARVAVSIITDGTANRKFPPDIEIAPARKGEGGEKGEIAEPGANLVNLFGDESVQIGRKRLRFEMA